MLSWLLSGKESVCQFRRHTVIPDPGRSRGEGNGNPLQFLDTTEQLKNNNSITYLSIIHWEGTNAHEEGDGVNIYFSIPK